jgi:uncharacterized protein (DUF983 family)
MNDNANLSPRFAKAALFGLCPKCGARSLFDGVAQFAPRCRACGLDCANFNVAFITLIVGAVLVGLALWLEVSVQPPVWVHLVLWPPLVIGATIWGLRLGKAALLIAEFQRSAGEGQIKK